MHLGNAKDDGKRFIAMKLEEHNMFDFARLTDAISGLIAVVVKTLIKPVPSRKFFRMPGLIQTCSKASIKRKSSICFRSTVSILRSSAPIKSTNSSRTSAPQSS